MASVTMPELSLTEFLLARIADDETLARQVDNPITSDITPLTLTAGIGHNHQGPVVALALGPVRLLAECEAKRQIIDWEKRYRTTVEHRGENWEHRATGNLRALAAIYADHPDYRDEWRP